MIIIIYATKVIVKKILLHRPIRYCYMVRHQFQNPFLTAKLEMWPQISTICRHNSKCDCKMLKVAVINRKVTEKC